MLGLDPHLRPVLLLPSFNSSCFLPAHTERVCLSFLLQLSFSPSTLSSSSSHSPAFLLLMTQTPDLLPLKLFFLDLQSPSASSRGRRINTTDSENGTVTEWTTKLTQGYDVFSKEINKIPSFVLYIMNNSNPDLKMIFTYQQLEYLRQSIMCFRNVNTPWWLLIWHNHTDQQGAVSVRNTLERD